MVERTAKEMFENLGYRLTEDNFITYKKQKDNWVSYISFDNKDKNIYCGLYKKENKNVLTVSVIDNNLLKAINKQVEELGWNNE